MSRWFSAGLRPMSCLLLWGASFMGVPAAAQGFSAYVTPPRFELQVQPGQRVREVIEIQHAGNRTGRFRIHTSDWTFLPDNTVTFNDSLLPGSCRPWVAIERREISVEPGARFRYRFEIEVPPDTPPGECRFALMIEGVEPARLDGALNFPVSGRIGVIVYAAVGGAQPRLSLTPAGVQQVNGQAVPVITVRNEGAAHGRLQGFLDARDAKGRRIELAPADIPVLPGDTRTVPLLPVVDEGVAVPAMSYPLQVTGQLESGSERLRVDQRFAP